MKKDAKENFTQLIKIQLCKDFKQNLEKRLKLEQIQELVYQRLKDFEELQFPLPDKFVFAEFIEYLKSRRKRIAIYPPKVIDALLDILISLAPTERWVSIHLITELFNEKSVTLGYEGTVSYSGKRVGDLLRDLCFTGRKRGDTLCVFVRHDLLRYYGKMCADSSNVHQATGDATTHFCT